MTVITWLAEPHGRYETSCCGLLEPSFESYNFGNVAMCLLLLSTSRSSLQLFWFWPQARVIWDAFCSNLLFGGVGSREVRSFFSKIVYIMWFVFTVLLKLKLIIHLFEHLISIFYICIMFAFCILKEYSVMFYHFRFVKFSMLIWFSFYFLVIPYTGACYGRLI